MNFVPGYSLATVYDFAEMAMEMIITWCLDWARLLALLGILAMSIYTLQQLNTLNAIMSVSIVQLVSKDGLPKKDNQLIMAGSVQPHINPPPD